MKLNKGALLSLLGIALASIGSLASMLGDDAKLKDEVREEVSRQLNNDSDKE